MSVNQNDVRTAEDVKIVLNLFYNRIREDELLGPIFNSSIKENKWPTHIDRIIKFWSRILFRSNSYLGNPVIIHQRVDQELKGGIHKNHFDLWLQIWENTINGLYDGNNAKRLIASAQNMSAGLLIKIINDRPIE